MDVIKLKPATKDYIWGGKKLFKYGKESDKDVIAESWELSYYPGMESVIDSGKDKGKFLKDVASVIDLGTNIKNHPFFPVLIKLIDANQDLSIQVHPSDDYALKYENSYGKTEMWYVLDAEEFANLYIGFNKDLSKEELKERIENNTLLDVMNHVKVKPGDCYFVPSGTIHAIGKGSLIVEIQENSNLTYRVYDYGRKDKNGNTRELHIDKAFKVLNLNKMEPKNIQDNLLADYSYFKVTKEENVSSLKADKNSFISFTVLDGEGFVNDLNYKKGDTFFIPANKEAIFSGSNKLIITRIN